MDEKCRTVPGFTLVESLIVLAVVAVVLGIAVPAFQRLSESTGLRAAGSHLFVDILYTRSEAIKRNSPVVMCPSEAWRGGVVACNGAFARGWAIFEDRDHDREPGPGEPVLRLAPALDPGFTLTNRAATAEATEKIIYLPDGSSRRNRTLMLCSRRQPGVASLSVVLNTIGRPRMARNWGECPRG